MTNVVLSPNASVIHEEFKVLVQRMQIVIRDNVLVAFAARVKSEMTDNVLRVKDK